MPTLARDMGTNSRRANGARLSNRRSSSTPTTLASAVAPSPASSRAALHYLRDISFLSQVMQGRTDFAQLVGLTFNNRRDTYSTLGYDKALSILHYRARYERGGIAERIIDSFPFATWAGGARIIEDTNPDRETEFERQVRIVFDKLDVWGAFQRADILASLGHFSVIFLGASGDPTTDISTAAKPLDIAYLKIIAEDSVQIAEWVDRETDITNPRYGLPLFYQLSIRTSTGGVRAIRVHHSRVIHVAEGVLDNPLIGRPRLRAPWNYLLDLDKIVGGGSEAAWKRMDPGLQVDVDPAVELDEDDEQKLDEELDAYGHDVSRMLRTRGTKITPLSTQAQSFSSNADALIKLISAATSIPNRILTGSERGQLASTQDRFNWSDRINERRRAFATPLIRLFIKRLINGGAIVAPAGYDEALSISSVAASALATAPAIDTASTSTPPQTGSGNKPSSITSLSGGYMIVWPDVGETSETDKAEIANKLAAANQAQSIAGLAPILTSDDIRHLVFNLGPMPQATKDEIAKAQADKAAAKAAATPAPFSSLNPATSTTSDPASPATGVATPSGGNTPSAPSRGAAAGK